MITPRALGVYVYLSLTGAPISAESLSRIFPGGRKMYLTTLRELRGLGLIETKRGVINGKYVTYSELTDINYGSPEKELLYKHPQLNSLLNLIANLADKQTESTRGASETYPNMVEIGKDMTFLGQMDNDPDEIAELRRKERERKHKEKVEYKEKQYQARMQKRDPNNASAWSVTDSAFHFADAVHSLWHVQPWQVTRGRFIYALGDKRKEYGTDGEVEKTMIELYISSIRHEKSLNDPEIIWKRFITQFGSLLIEAQRIMVTPEDIAAAKEKSKKTFEWMDNV